MAGKRKSRRVIKSGFEDRAKKLFKDNGVKAEYEKETLKYIIQGTYTPDFIIYDPDTGKPSVFIETKGYFDTESRRKMKAVKEAHPDLDIRIWFQKDQYLTKAKKGKYSTWAKRNGFEYHIGEDFPLHWFTQ